MLWKHRKGRLGGGGYMCAVVAQEEEVICDMCAVVAQKQEVICVLW